jgi:hypothetical protein
MYFFWWKTFLQLEIFFFLHSGFLPPPVCWLWSSFSGCFFVVFSGRRFSSFGLIYALFCFFALKDLEIVFLSCCFFYVTIFWHFLSFLWFMTMFSWVAWFLDWGNFCYDFLYVDGQPFIGFEAFSDSFIFCYSWIAFGNL